MDTVDAKVVFSTFKKSKFGGVVLKRSGFFNKKAGF